MDISFFGAAAGGLTLCGIDPALDVEAREYKLADGRFLSGDLDARHVVLVEDYADDKDIQVGDDVQLVTSQGVEKVRVVGLISKEGAGQLHRHRDVFYLF